MHEQGKIWDLYKDILQIGVAIYHAKRSNFKGAMRLVSSGMELLSPFAPDTGPGLTSQVEMGVLIRGAIARQIEDFWDYAVEIGLFLLVT